MFFKLSVRLRIILDDDDRATQRVIMQQINRLCIDFVRCPSALGTWNLRELLDGAGPHHLCDALCMEFVAAREILSFFAGHVNDEPLEAQCLGAEDATSFTAEASAAIWALL